MKKDSARRGSGWALVAVLLLGTGSSPLYGQSPPSTSTPSSSASGSKTSSSSKNSTSGSPKGSNTGSKTTKPAGGTGSKGNSTGSTGKSGTTTAKPASGSSGASPSTNASPTAAPPANGAAVAPNNTSSPSGTTPPNGAPTSTTTGTTAQPDAVAAQAPSSPPPKKRKLPRHSNARYALQVPGYTVSGIAYRGAGRYAAADVRSPSVNGYRFSERGGVISGLVLGGITRLSMLLLAGMPSSASISSTTYSRTNASGQTEIVTEETRTATYDNPAGRQALLDGSGDVMKGMVLHRGQAFELDLFTRDWLGFKEGEARGYRVNFLMTVFSNRHFAIESGLGVGRVNSLIDEQKIIVEERYLGIPVRLLVPWGPLWGQVALDLNWRTLGDLHNTDLPDALWVEDEYYYVVRTRPWPLSVSLNANLWRLAVSVGVESSRPWKGDFGGFATLGVRL